MTGLGLALHQYRYDQRQFWREPASVFFTVGLPLIFLFLFTSIFGNEKVKVGGSTFGYATYFLPGIIALSLISATFVNLTIWLTIARDRGQLKRVRATPAPISAVLGGRTLNAIGVTTVMVVVVVAIGAIVYGVEVPTDTLPAAILTLVLGVAAFSALAFAFASVVPSENAAPPMSNAVVLPLYFISGIFIPQDQIPDWMNTVAGVFPIRPLFQALLHSLDPATGAPGLQWGHLAVIAAWGVAGAVYTLLRFRWTPRV